MLIVAMLAQSLYHRLHVISDSGIAIYQLGIKIREHRTWWQQMKEHGPAAHERLEIALERPGKEGRKGLQKLALATSPLQERTRADNVKGWTMNLGVKFSYGGQSGLFLVRLRRCRRCLR